MDLITAIIVFLMMVITGSVCFCFGVMITVSNLAYESAQNAFMLEQAAKHAEEARKAREETAENIRKIREERKRECP